VDGWMDGGGGGWRDRTEAMKVKNAGMRLGNAFLCLFFLLLLGRREKKETRCIIYI
jgi:hypothetical protein